MLFFPVSDFHLGWGVRVSGLSVWYFCKLNPLTHKHIDTNPNMLIWRKMILPVWELSISSHCHKGENKSARTVYEKVHDSLVL